MGKKLCVFLVLVAMGGVFAFLWYGAERKVAGELTLYGNVDQRQIELAFIDAERIAEVLVEEGAKVEPGQVLARLETRRLRDRIAVLAGEASAAEARLALLQNGTRPEEIDQARAVVASASAEAAYAAQQYERFNTIWRDSKGAAVSLRDVDEWRSRHVSAQAGLDAAKKSLVLAQAGPRKEEIAEAEALFLAREKALEETRNRLKDAELKSPVASVVRSRLMEPGDMASSQRPVFSLAVVSPKWVRAYVAETDFARVRPGMGASIFIDSFPGKGIPGTVGFISSVAEFTPKTVQTPDLRTALVYEIRVHVDDAEDVLRLGMPATVVFPRTTPESGR